MVLAELLSCCHFPVVAGLSPSIHKLDADTDTHTRDWVDEDAFAPSDPSGLLQPRLGDNPMVQTVIAKIWDHFQKAQDNTVCREEYEGFVRRIIRCLLPGLAPEKEQALCSNAWEEDALGLDRMSFAQFFNALVNLARMWTDFRDPSEGAVFLEDLFRRCTTARLIDGETGFQTKPDLAMMVTIRAEDGDPDPNTPDSDFGTALNLQSKGSPPKFKLDVQFDANQKFTQVGMHLCWLDEFMVDPLEGAPPSTSLVREWTPLEEVVPIGRAILKVLEQAERSAKEGPIDISFTGQVRADTTTVSAVFATLCRNRPPEGVKVFVRSQPRDDGGDVVLKSTGLAFGITNLLVGALCETGITNVVILRPSLKSPLYKLQRLRRELSMRPVNAAKAALLMHGSLESMAAVLEGSKLPTFVDMLENTVELDPKLGIYKHIIDDSELMNGTLNTLAEALGQSSMGQGSVPPELPTHTERRGMLGPSGGDAFVNPKFPPLAEGVDNDDADLLSIANAPPVTIWVFGECDSAGEYKTEVCRRVADHLKLQWLNPAHLLQVAVNTPQKYRSKLADRCAQQLTRGMGVSTVDALSLTLEMMASSRCITNGYVLDFPPVTPADEEAVADFALKVKQLSASSEVVWGEYFQDNVELPPPKPDPEPPAPEPEEGADGAGEGEEGAAVPPADEGDEPPAEEEPTATEPETGADPEEAEEEPREPGDQDEPEEEEEEELVEEGPREPPIQNRLVNCMPRRMVVLSMDRDELGTWKLACLKARHVEKQRKIDEAIAAGEDPPEDEEEAAEEAAGLPLDDEDQLKEHFDKFPDDVFSAMEEVVKPPSLEPPKKLPELPNENETLAREEDGDPSVITAFKSGMSLAYKGVHELHKVPILTLHADGRVPNEMAELVLTATGGFPGPTVTMLNLDPSDSPQEALRVALADNQSDRRWSQWKLHCPVSLIDRVLAEGSLEFAVDFNGYVLLFADANKRSRFCSWPKHYLQQAPRINGPGMALGYILLSPCQFRTKELAANLHTVYGFDVVDIVTLLEEAMSKPPLVEEVEVPPALGDEEEAAPPPPVEEDPGPRLKAAEKEAIAAGHACPVETIVRLIARALGMEKNINIVARWKENKAAVVAEVARKAEAGEEPDPDLVMDENGEPVVDLPEPLATPQRGFVLVGFPESAEHLALLKDQVRLEFEQVLIVEKLDDDVSPEVDELLRKASVHETMPIDPILESQSPNFANLANVEGLKISKVRMEAELNEQVVLIRKLIDPFYPVVEEAGAAAIPDPDDWQPDDPQDGEEDQEPQERPTIPWGVLGRFCPVTLKDDFWLFPGQKAFDDDSIPARVMFRNRVYAFANATNATAFIGEPIKYIPQREPSLPPPRILITGPSGSGVEKQCELLSQVYKIPVIQLAKEWEERAEARRKACVEQRKKELAVQAAADDPMLEGELPNFPAGWIPPEPKPEGEGEEEEEEPVDAEPEPEDDGLDLDQREQLFIDALRDVLGSHRGACILNGTFFKDLTDSTVEDDVKEKRTLQNLLIKGLRLPDVVLILKCKNQTAADRALDYDKIDAEYKVKKDAYEAERQKAEDAGDDEPPRPDYLYDDDEDEGFKASDKEKEAFIERKKEQQNALKDFVEALEAVRATIHTVSCDRGDAPTHKAIRWHCRPFMEHRASLLLRDQLRKVRPKKEHELRSRSLCRQSRFQGTDPMKSDEPAFSGRNNWLMNAVELRRRLYYPRTEEEQNEFMTRPMDFLHLPAPSRVMVNFAISVIGPPLSGKTSLAKWLAQRTGAIYLSIPEIIEGLCKETALPCPLSHDLVDCMQRGNVASDALVIKALRHRLTAVDVVRCGWVLDDFPLTEQQSKAMAAAGIVPHRVLMLQAPEHLVFERAREASGKSVEGNSELVQQEVHLQRKRYDAYAARAPMVRSFYGLTYLNVVDINGGTMPWAINDQALREASAAVSQRLEYYRRTAAGKPAKIHGMCFEPSRLSSQEGAWRHFCPVTLTLSNEIVPCTDARTMVEYNSKIYWFHSKKNQELFLQDPEAFLQVPLIVPTPQLLPVSERLAKPEVMLEGYCPVALVDKKELLKTKGQFIVRFQGKCWSFADKESCSKFMRRPMRYKERAAMPSKKPPVKGEHTVSLLSALSRGREGRLEPAEMLTYMQASVAEVICQALVESGERRPLYPGRSAQESALLFLASFLRARDTLNTDLSAARVRKQLEDFLGDCELPSQVKAFAAKQKLDDGSWTGSDAHRFKEICGRFDEIFGLNNA